MQLVLSGKNIVAYGEGFLAMGGTVINPDTGAVHQNATIVECENCPADLGKVGYEYHAGEFVPCGPFGEGDGTIAVWCNDCKTPRDSGLKVSEMGKIYHTEYKGTGVSSGSVTCGFRPKLIIISGSVTGGGTGKTAICIMWTSMGGTGAGSGVTFYDLNNASANDSSILAGLVSCTANDTGATWAFELGDSRYASEIAMNADSSSTTGYYSITVFG